MRFVCIGCHFCGFWGYFNHFCQQVHFLFIIFSACMVLRGSSHKHWTPQLWELSYPSVCGTDKLGFIPWSPQLNIETVQVFIPSLNMLNQACRSQRMTMLFSSPCFGHSFISYDSLTVAVSCGQHVIVPPQSNKLTSVQWDLGEVNTAELCREICGSMKDKMNNVSFLRMWKFLCLFVFTWHNLIFSFPVKGFRTALPKSICSSQPTLPTVLRI